MGFDMFSGFKNMSTTYTPNNYQPKYPDMCNNRPTQVTPVVADKPFELKDAQGNVTGYFWYYGNTVELVFDITGEILFDNMTYVPASEFIQTFQFSAEIYDFRHMRILEFNSRPDAENQLLIVSNSQPDFGGSIVLTLTPDLSAKLVKGVYSLVLTATHPAGFQATLFNHDSASLEVR